MQSQTPQQFPADTAGEIALTQPPVALEFIVEEYLSGSRVDSVLEKHLRNYTSWRLMRMTAAGLVTVNGLPASPRDRVFAGQSLRIQLAEPPDKLLDPVPRPVRVVYEDLWLTLVNKEAGVVVHPVGEFQEDTLAHHLQAYLDRQTLCRGLLRPGIVHRLDRMTSGLLVTTKEHLSHRLLSLDFQQGRLSKSYLVLVEGNVAFDSRMVDLPIGSRRRAGSVLMTTAADAHQPRPARTRLNVLQRFDDYTLLQATLLTGRNHQIRVHCAALGHPVAGDEFYGPFGKIRSDARAAGTPDDGTARHALHAARLGFLHPILREWMEFSSSPPDEFWNLAGLQPADYQPSHRGAVV